MSRSKGGLFSGIQRAIQGRRRTEESRYQRRNFLRLEALESRAMLTGLPPVAVADGPFTVNEDETLIVDITGGVLANDTDNEGDPLTAAVTDNVDFGTLNLASNGSFVYTPNTDFVGADSFTYVASDGTGQSNPVTVTINVTAINDDPVAADDAYSVQQDDTLTVDVVAGVLANDSDVDHPPSALSAVQVGAAVNGTVVLNPNGSFTFTPTPGYSGAAEFTYEVHDEDNGISNEATVTITVVPSEDPTISDIPNQTTSEDQAIANIPVTVGDAQTPAQLTVTVSSSDQTLIPDANLVLGGSGTERTLSITPALNESGSATITVTVTDGDGNSTSDTFDVIVTAVNDAPTITDIGDQTTPFNTAIVDLPFTIADVDNDVAAIEPTAESDNQTLITNANLVIEGTGANRTITITPEPGQSGTATITVTVADGAGGTVTDTFTVTVGANTLPTISDVANQTTDEDTAIVDIPVTIGDAETAAATLQLTATSDNQELIPNGNITVGGSGANRTVSINPAGNQFGTATITLTVNDGNGGTVTDTFVVTVDPVNDLPEISDVANQTIVENGTLSGVAVDIGDLETADDDLEVTASSDNATLFPPGSIVVSTTGGTRTLSLTPAAGETGSATITLTVDDGNGGTATDTFEVTVTSNTPPTITGAANQTTDEDTELTGVEVTVADGETPAADLVLTAVSDNQTLIPNDAIEIVVSGGTRTISITPAENEFGTATITLTLSDGNGGSTTETFVVTVNSVNDLPTIQNITDQTVAENGSIAGLAVVIGDVETDEADLDLTGASSNTTLIPNSAIVFGGSGANRTVTITPAAGEVGTATITITVSDANGGETVETFLVTVTEPNTPPTITPVADLSTNEDTATGSISVTIGDAETPGTLQLTAVSSNTTLVPNSAIQITGTGANRTIVITPAANQSGNTTITLTVNDGNGGTTTETFVLTVNPVNDPPTAVNDTYTTAEDTALNITSVTTGVLGNDSDPENEALTTVLVLAPPTGQLVLNSNGTFTYTPAANFVGAVTFQYRAEDASGAVSSIATVTINVTNTNDAPTAVADGYTVSTGNTLTVSAANGVLANDSDPDSGTTLTAVVVTSTTNGTLNLAANGSFTYTPNAGFSGTDSFTYRASDGTLQSSPVTVTIAVSSVNAGQPIIVGPTSGVRGQTLTYELSVAGGTSANVSYAIDWNGDGTNDQTVTGPGTGVTVTHVFATAGTNNVRVQIGSGSTTQSVVLPVTIADFQRAGSTFVVGGTSGNDTIIVQQVGRAGIRVLVNGTAVGGVQTGVRSVEVFGGDGNDNIVMPGNVNASAIFHGGAGNDRLQGGRLSDFLFGDDGNDLLAGLGGSDFLAGGGGNDSLSGGEGHDVLFGGDGADSLVGGSHHNLMIGGTTDFDTNFKAQKAILHAWAAGGTFEHRMNRLNFMSKGGLKLVENDTVQSDGEADRVVANGSRDWVFAALADSDQVTGKAKGRIVSFA